MKGLLVLVATLSLAACTGRPNAPSLGPTALDLEIPFAQAAEKEQLAPSAEAMEAYLALLDRAVALPSAPHALEAVLASLDALVFRKTPSLEELSEHHALAFRSPSGMALVRDRLVTAWESAGRSGPFVRPAIARAAYALAMYEGDASKASIWRERMGCAREATVVGPLEGAPLSSLRRASWVESRPELAASYPGIAPFAGKIEPLVVQADECALPTDTTSALDGWRAVVVDIDLPRPMRMGLSLKSASAAVVVVGGKVAIDRDYARGGASLHALGTAEVPKGRTRIVVRLAQRGEGRAIELHLHDDEGKPLPYRAPRPGDVAPVVVERASELRFDAIRRTAEERALVAAAELALDDGRPAAYRLERAEPHDHPLLALFYARALDEAAHLPPMHRAERSRASLERVRMSWPGAWEARLGLLRLEARRRGDIEGRLSMIRELREARETTPSPMVPALEAAMAASSSLPDWAREALGSAKPALSGTPVLAQLEARLRESIGAEHEAFVCTTAGLDRSSLACHDAKNARGDRNGALAEISRLRELRGSPSALRGLELGHYLALSDAPKAMAVYRSMHPSERLAGTLGLLAEKDPKALRELLDDALAARDMPAALGPLHRALGDDPAADFEAEGAKIRLAERGHRVDAATWVLLHRERYTLQSDGRLHYVLYDLRRVSGTTDVELGAQMPGPLVQGREARWTRSRRIFKADGRIVEPDRAPHAAQGHADLSELQPGDFIEQILEGFALPDATGQLVVDTPDLLPERTRVREASIEIVHPKGLPLKIGSHPLLGAARERTSGEMRITSYSLRDRAPRRLELGVSSQDQDVASSFGTATWEGIASFLAELPLLLDDADPHVSSWAREASEGSEGRKLVERLVMASGKAIRVASPFELSDWAAIQSLGSQTTSARTMLELGEGSRSWLVYRALSELGIPVELRLAEREPDSVREDRPARLGQFHHPLLVVHRPDEDVWLDLDIPGPPLPAGRVSPELRGRMALGHDGKLVPIPSGKREKDEIDLRLKLNEAGDATGTVEIVLRGRPSQYLADALEQVVGGEREGVLRNVVLGFLPQANVEEVALKPLTTLGELALSATVSIPRYAQPEGKAWTLPGTEPLHVVYPYPSAATLGGTFASLLERESALSIEMAEAYRLKRRIELPEGTKLASPLPDARIVGRHLEATRTAKLEGRVLDEEVTLSLTTGRVPREEYEGFLETARRIDEAFLRALRLELRR